MVRSDEINFLTGIRVELANGMRSPDFRASDHGNTQTPPTVIDVSKCDVSSVSVKVHRDSSGFLFYERLVPLQTKDSPLCHKRASSKCILCSSGLSRTLQQCRESWELPGTKDPP